MVSDGKGLLASEAHIARRDIDALLSVAVGESIVVLEGIDSLPYATLVLDVAEALFINSDLAKIVKQSGNSDRLVGVLEAKLLRSVGLQVADEAIVDVERMLAETALVGGMVSCRCGSRKEVGCGRVEVLEQLVSALSGYVFLIYFDKSFLGGNRFSPCASFYLV